MEMQIKLKAKYRTDKRITRGGVGSSHATKAKPKRNSVKMVHVPKYLFVDGLTGKSRMMTGKI